MRTAKLIHDNEFNDTPFASPYEETAKLLRKHVMSDFILDADYLISNYMYDSRLYSPFLIGLDVYTYTLFGEGHRRGGLKAIADEIKVAAKDEETA